MNCNRCKQTMRSATQTYLEFTCTCPNPKVFFATFSVAAQCPTCKTTLRGPVTTPPPKYEFYHCTTQGCAPLGTPEVFREV